MDDVNQNKDWGTYDELDETGVDPRAHAVILAAHALKFLRVHEPGTPAAHTLHRLRWCLDSLLLLASEMPPMARELFGRLDTKVQVVGIRLAKDPQALDAAREELIEGVMQLGDALMSDLMPPVEEELDGD